MNQERKEQCRKVICDHIGTCSATWEEMAEDLNITSDEEKEFCELLDSLMFRCEVCGWWCGDDEESENESSVCQECSEE